MRRCPRASKPRSTGGNKGGSPTGYPHLYLVGCQLARTRPEGGGRYDIAQTVWNNAFGFAPEHGIADIDLVYFDAGDLSEATEHAHETRVRRAFSDVQAKFDVKNEARVHLWYETNFGVAIAPYTSTANAIGTFPTTATSIGIRPDGADVAVVAPFGLADLLGLTVRPNKTLVTREVYEAKTRRWRAEWPGLTIIDW